MSMQLIDTLLKQEKINSQKRDELKAIIDKSGKTEEEVLLDHQIIPEQELFEIKSKLVNVPFLKPNTQEVPLEVLELISEEAAINYKIAPLFKKGNSVGIGMVYPENILAQNALRFLSQKEHFNYQVYLVSFSDINNILKQHRTLKREASRALNQFSKEKGDILNNLSQDSSPSNLADEEAPIIKMVLVILRHAIEGNASDIHIEPGREKLNVRFRQDGSLHLSLFLPLNVHSSIVARIKILANLKIDENRIPQDGRFSARIHGKDIDFRVATLPTLYGEKVEIRILNPEEGAKSLNSLGMNERNLKLVEDAIQKPYGLILASGPTGSGKTTTLYALMRILNKETANVVTIEDPIEYSVDGVNQSQVRPEIGYTFAHGLRQILRQDPDVIMVGEMRDEDTASLVIHAALTGHVVLSTLHTNSAVGSIPRLMDMGIKPFLIPSTVRLIISQRLIRTLCENCKKKVSASENVKRYVVENIKSMPLPMRKQFDISGDFLIYEANGCAACNFKGYKGRTGLFEVLPMTEELSEIILSSPLERSVLQIAQKQGMFTMTQEGILKVLSGETTIDEITRVTQEK